MSIKFFRAIVPVLLIAISIAIPSIRLVSAQGPILFDNFDDNKIDSSIWSIDSFGTGPSIDEIGQHLDISMPANSSEGLTSHIFFASYLSICQIHGDFDSQVDYSLLKWPSGNGVRVGLNADSVDPQQGSSDIERTSYGSANDFPGQPRDVYTTSFGGAPIPSGDLSGKLRITRSGNVVSGYYYNSTAESPWVLFDSGTAPNTDIHIRLAAWSHSNVFTGQDVEIAFDNFVLNQGQLVCPQPTTYSVSGNVSDASGIPVADVTISTDTGKSVMTNSSGHYSIDLPVGDYILTPVKEGYSFSPSSVSINLPRDTGIQDFKATHIRKVIVFLQGVCTSVKNGTDTDNATFKDLQKLLKQSQYGYHDSDFLLYSYKGGSVDDRGIWHHKAYGKSDPIRQDFSTTSLAALHDQLLVPYYAKHPDTTFVLVGHSLGGIVAFEELYRKVNTPDYNKGFISTVVTVDSPLHGGDPTEFLGAQALSSKIPDLKCIVDGQSASKLVFIHNNEPNTTNDLKATATEAKRQGITWAAVGNTYDCVWSPSKCNVPGISGDINTQWVFGSDVLLSQFDIPKPCLKRTANCITGTHSAALDQKLAPSALRTIATYIGPQN